MGFPPEENLNLLQVEAARFGTEPYLVTVTAGHEPHCSVVAVDWGVGTGRMVVRAPSNWAESDANGLRQVTLLWSPREPGGYSLIVNGVAAWADGPSTHRLGIVATRAVLHRPGAPSSPGSSCGSDCVPILGP